VTRQRIDSVICPFCGCLCDDLALTIEAGRIAATENACRLAEAGFAAFPGPDQPPALIAGRPGSLDEALDSAARLLLSARFPLVYGLTGISCEAQRQTVALADLLAANLDLAGDTTQRATALAFQQAGANSATLGEIKNNADLVVFWGADPAVTHPRHLGRYSVLPRSRQLPNGRRDRTVIVLDHAPTATAREADLFFQTQAGRDFEALWALRALVRGLPATPALAAEAGLPLEALTELASRLGGCRYGAVFYGERLAHGLAGPHTVAALLALVSELNAHTHVVAQGLGGHGNAAGAENVLAWQTGYAQAVNFSRGYPRSNPGEFSAAELLTRGEADVTLVVAADATAGLPSAAVDQLGQRPGVLISPRATSSGWARVAITTASFGVESGGTAFRVDEVPLSLRPALDSPYPATEVVLMGLLQRLTPTCAERAAAWRAHKARLESAPGV
jgi:formylmethanofuran dehydrogenase subunit B